MFIGVFFETDQTLLLHPGSPYLPVSIASPFAACWIYISGNGVFSNVPHKLPCSHKFQVFEFGWDDPFETWEKWQ
jgi:hypothetical protein